MKRLKYAVAFIGILTFVGLILLTIPRETVAQTGSISGLGEINYRYLGTSEHQSRIKSGFRAEDFMFFVKGSPGNKVDFFSEFLINPNSPEDEVHSAHDQTISVERLYVSTTALLPEHTVKAGIFQVFDGTIKNYHKATGNPLPGELIFFENPWTGHHGARTLHSVFTELGLSISGNASSLKYTGAVFNGMGERTPTNNEYDNANISGAYGKIAYVSRALPGFQAGLSYYYAKGLEIKATGHTGQPLGPAVAPVNQYLIGEIVYRKPSFKITGLYLNGVQTRPVSHDVHEAFNIPFGSFDHKGQGLLGEIMYNWTREFSSIVRYQTIIPNDKRGTNFIGAGTQPTHHGVQHRGRISQLEIGLKYNITPRFSIKASWKGNYEEEHNIVGNLVMGQIVASF